MSRIGRRIKGGRLDKNESKNSLGPVVSAEVALGALVPAVHATELALD